MPNDIQEITPKSEVPDWATETPEFDDTYKLVMFEDDAEVQGVYLDRAEYLALKWVLARRRGLPVPKDEPAPAESKPEAAGPTNGKPAGVLITDRLIDDAVKDIMSRLRMNDYYREHAHDLNEGQQNNRNEYRADIQLLREILVSWECGSFANDYPNELPLVAAIRGYLEP